MPLPDDYLQRIAEDHAQGTQQPKRGEEIFAGTDYPRDWSGFVGQDKAKLQLQVQIASAKARGTRLEHTLLASGLHGVGKSTLATLVAAEFGAGFLQTSGPLTVDDARALIQGMVDRDILFIDEAHQLTTGNRTKADWLLPFMTEGRLYTDRGAEEMPNVTIVAATTDVGKLPETLISRFMSQPQLVPYTPEQGALIVGNLAGRMGVELDDPHWPRIAQAADCNPRVARQILVQVRDLQHFAPDTHPNLDQAFEWAGVSEDGLSLTSREILILLFMATDHTASIDSIKAHLGEPGPIRYHETALLRRGYLEVTSRGRKLTDAGILRAQGAIKAMRENR